MTAAEHLKYLTGSSLAFWQNLKHLHWSTYGPMFPVHHEFFGTYADTVYAQIDPLAERLRMLNIDVPLDLQPYNLIDPLRERETPTEMLECTLRCTAYFCEGMGEAITAAEKDGDYGTVDLLSKFVQDHEKARWYLRQMLKTD